MTVDLFWSPRPNQAAAAFRQGVVSTDTVVQPGDMGAQASGSEAARFALLFQASRPRLWLVAAAVLGDRSEAEDVVQEAAIVGMRKFAEFSDGTSFDAWMGQITRNLALNARRARTRRGNALDRHNQRTPQGSSSMNGLPEHDERLSAAMEKLDEISRTCLLLRVVGQTPYHAIAQMLGIPEGTCMSHVHRARRQLAAWLARPELTLSRGGTQ
jgi:RNA polymerase sigma-70 factor (ECF subfamily)